MPSPSVILCASHSFHDPLFQGLLYQYVRQHQAKSTHTFRYHLITEEQAAYAISLEEQKRLQAELAQQNLYWHPIPYRGGRFIILKKLWNFIGLFFLVWGIKRREKARLIVGFLAIAGGYAWMLSKVLRLTLMVFCFEPHSLYMREFGIWSASSLKYKLLSRVERWQATQADYVTAPTKHTVQLLKDWNSQAKIFRVPISVDTEKFVYSEEARHRLRKKLYLPEKRYTIMYLGKFGGIYYSVKEVAAFCRKLQERLPELFFLIISPTLSEEVKNAFYGTGMGMGDALVIGRIPYEEIEDYISACDMGMVAIPPLDSQRYRTPVKIGNYLACGLPILLNRGIADDDDMTEEEGVGIVLDSLTTEDLEGPVAQLKNFIQADPTALRAHCREVAIRHRGLHNSVNVLEQVFTAVYHNKS